jgi:hypothetical protein
MVLTHHTWRNIQIIANRVHFSEQLVPQIAMHVSILFRPGSMKIKVKTKFIPFYYGMLKRN